MTDIVIVPDLNKEIWYEYNFIHFPGFKATYKKKMFSKESNMYCNKNKLIFLLTNVLILSIWLIVFLYRQNNGILVTIIFFTSQDLL